jgi:hypothetical protein
MTPKFPSDKIPHVYFFNKGFFMKCYVCGDLPFKRHGRANLCAKHGRFIQMQKAAKQDKKYVPSLLELEKISTEHMCCPDCGVQMNWIDGNQRSAGAVLQHYRNGTIGIVCFSCNTKHGSMDGDSYLDLPLGHKLCRSCKTIKPLECFGKRAGAGKPESKYPKSSCKECDLKKTHAWREKNKDAYKMLTKKHNDNKKLNLEKYRALDRLYYKKRKDAANAGA